MCIRDRIGDDAIEKYLNGTIADLYDGMLMKDMDKAVAVLGEKIKENAKIRIIGDYDLSLIHIYRKPDASGKSD